MSTSIGNSKVYLFLAKTERNLQENGSKIKEWQLYADKIYGNADGVVSQAEFEQFINAEYLTAMGEKLSSRDFNLFWSSVDTDKVDFRNADGDKVNGAYNLSAKEIEALDKEMEDFVKLDAVCVKAEANLQGLFDDYEDKKQWKSLVTTKLALALEEWRANGRPDGDFEKYMTQGKGLQQFATIQAEATATVQKDNVIEDWISDPNTYWDELAELDPPYDLGNDTDIDNAINELVIKKIRESDITDVSKIKDLLVSIRGEIEEVIKDTIAKKGRNEKGEAIAVPDLDENGDPVKDTDGNYVPNNEVITDTQIQSWTAQLMLLLKSKDFMNAIPEDHKAYANVYKEAGKTWINNKIDELSNTYKDNFTGFNEAVNNISAASIVEELQKDQVLQTQITQEIAWKNYETNMINKLNNGDLSEEILLNVETPEVIEYLEKNVLKSLQDNIIGKIRDFATYTENGIDEDNAWGKIVEYAKKEVATKLATNYQTGYNTRGTQEDSKENRALDIYNDLNNIINLFTTDEATKNAQYAQIALGYFKDVANRGYADIIKDVIGVNASALTAEDLAADGKEKVSQWVTDVHNAVLEKIANANKEPGNTGDTTTGKSWDEVDKTQIMLNGKYTLDYILKQSSIGGIKLSDFTSWADAINNAKTNISNIISALGSDLITKGGMDSTAVNNAIKKTTTLYCAVLDNIYDPTSGGDRDINQQCKISEPIYYTDANGKIYQYNEEVSFGHFGTRKAKNIDIENGAGMKSAVSGFGLRVEEECKGDNTFTIGVNMKALVNMFVSML